MRDGGGAEGVVVGKGRGEARGGVFAECIRADSWCGCAVVVEKPFTPTHAEAEELIALAKKHGRILTVYQSKCFPRSLLSGPGLGSGGRQPFRYCLLLWMLIWLGVASRSPLGLRLPDPLAARPGRHTGTHRRGGDAFRPLPPCCSGRG